MNTQFMKLVLGLVLTLLSSCKDYSNRFVEKNDKIDVLYTQFVEPKGMRKVVLTEIPPMILNTVRQIDWSRLKLRGIEPEGQTIHGWEVASITLLWFDGRTPRALNILASGQVICDSGEVFDGAAGAYQSIIDVLIDQKLIDEEHIEIPYPPPPLPNAK